MKGVLVGGLVVDDFEDIYHHVSGSATALLSDLRERRGRLTDLAVFWPLRALRKQRRPNGAANGDMCRVHDPYRPGPVVVLGVELDRVSFLVIRDVGD